jgi:hypothetical protein
MNDVDPLLDESTLRRALRLEVDERPPRLNASALERAATRMPSRAALAVTAMVAAALLVAGVVVGVTVGEAVWTFATEGPAQATLLDAGISVAVLLAVPLWDAISTLTAPAAWAVPVAAVVLAVLIAGAQRRELISADAS